MGKILKVIAVIAIAAAVIYFAPEIAVALGPVLGTTAAAAVTQALVATAISAAISTTIAAFAGKPSATSAGTPSIFRQSISNSFIVYGKRRVGGLLIFYHPRQVSKKEFYRYYVIAVAGHRCQGVLRWFLGDEAVGVNGATGAVTSGKYAGNAWLWFYRGTDNQAAHPTFVAETEGKWTSAHRGRGTALIYAKFKLTDDVVQAGMPNITAEITGKDDISDPRTNTTGYTRNGALVFYDWMRIAREEGGFGSFDDELDDDWISAQANVCDEDVALAAGGVENRYELDCYITTGAAPSEVRDGMVTCMAGSFTYSGGKMLMRPGYYVPPSARLHERDLAGPITVPALRSGDEITSEVSGTYIDATNLYQPKDAPTRWVESEDVRQSALDLPHITSGTRAQRIMEIALRKSLAERRVTWPMNIMGIAISTLDTVQLATARYGLSNYSFQTVGWTLAQDFSVVLQLEEHSPDIFDWSPSMEHTVGDGGQLARADPIGENRAAHQILEGTQTVDYPVTSDDDSISVAAFTATIDTGQRLNFPAAQFDGLSAGTGYLVLWDMSAKAYLVGEPISQQMLDGIADADNVIIRYYSTASDDGSYPSSPTAPGGDRGGGYNGRSPNTVNE